MSPDDLLSQEQVAKLLRITTGTLANYRVRGDGPAFVKVKPIQYRRTDVEEYINSKVRRSTSDGVAA
jgi:hypothetical protein